MVQTTINDLSDQVKEYWSDMFMQELRSTNMMIDLCNRDYEGEIKEGGNQVKVTQWNAAVGETAVIGTDDETFTPEKATASQVAITADRIFSASFDFTTTAQLQTQLASAESEMRNALLHGVSTQVNNFLYGLFSAAAPASAVTDYNAAELAANRKFAGQKKWNKDGEWYNMVDPSYYIDILNATTMSSTDYVEDRPLVAGQLGTKRYGFNIFEDNSEGLLSLIAKAGGAATEDISLAFHRNAIHFVSQMQPTFEVASLTSSYKRGFVIKVDLIGGGAQGHNHADLHRVTYNA